MISVYLLLDFMQYGLVRMVTFRQRINVICLYAKKICLLATCKAVDRNRFNV